MKVNCGRGESRKTWDRSSKADLKMLSFTKEMTEERSVTHCLTHEGPPPITTEARSKVPCKKQPVHSVNWSVSGRAASHRSQNRLRNMVWSQVLPDLT